jgi:hypothetical protein
MNKLEKGGILQFLTPSFSGRNPQNALALQNKSHNSGVLRRKKIICAANLRRKMSFRVVFKACFRL